MLALRDTAPVAVAPIAGAPRATAEKLAAAMSKALQERDVAASDRVVGLMSYQLDGRLQAMPPSGDKAAIVVLWKLHDPSGKLVGSRAERIVAGAEDWRLGKDDAVDHLAAASADQIAAMLHGKAPVEAAVAQQQTRLLVGPVKGAPGDGDRALAEAVIAVLKTQDLSIVTDPQAKVDLLLDARVGVDKPIDGKQHVKIVWRVRRADDSEIGTVAQQNDVPAGLLDGAWGDVAYTVAVAAESGIMQLIEHGAAPPAPKS
jgi:hypothetical protein